MEEKCFGGREVVADPDDFDWPSAELCSPSSWAEHRKAAKRQLNKQKLNTKFSSTAAVY
jgi:hypothetical protein